MPGKVDERKWQKAKKKVKEQGKDPENNYALVNHIYQNMGGKFEEKGASVASQYKKLSRDLRKPSRYADAEEVIDSQGNGTSPFSHLANYNGRKVRLAFSNGGVTIEAQTGVLEFRQGDSSLSVYSVDDTMVVRISPEEFGHELNWDEANQTYSGTGSARVARLTLLN